MIRFFYIVKFARNDILSENSLKMKLENGFYYYPNWAS